MPIERDRPQEAVPDEDYSGPHTTELEFDDPLVDPYHDGSADADAAVQDDADVLAKPEISGGVTQDDAAEMRSRKDTRGKLKARKVRRVVRYVSPWSVLKVSLLFYVCLWAIGTIASVLLWRVAVETGGITNVEKFIAKLFGEKSFTIDGREILRASTIAGAILVFAGTGFTVLMSLLFNVICDITGGIRFTVLELASTRRRLRKSAMERQSGARSNGQ